MYNEINKRVDKEFLFQIIDEARVLNEYYIADKKYSDISRRMGFKANTDEEGVNSLIAEVRKLADDVNIPKSFKEAGIEEAEWMAKVDELADRAFSDQCTTANPRLPIVEELKQILIDSYYGKNI